MKDVVWLMNEHPKHLPLMSAYLPNKTSQIIFIVFYVFLWIFSYFMHTVIKYSESVNKKYFILAFVIGLCLLLLHWFLTAQTYEIFAIGSGNVGKYALLKSNTNYKLVTDNELFKIPKEKIAMMSNEAYLEHKRSGALKDIDIQDYFKQMGSKQKTKGELWKQLKSSTFVNRTSVSQLDSIAYRFTSIILSLAVVTAKMNIQLFYALLPWFILATIFSIGTQTVFVFESLVPGVIEQYILKQKLLIVGLSFGMIALITILQG